MESKEYAIRMEAAAELLMGDAPLGERLNAADVERMLVWNRRVETPSPAVSTTYGTLLGLQAVVGRSEEQRLEGMQEYPREYKELVGVLADQVRQLTDEQSRAPTFAKRIDEGRSAPAQAGVNDDQQRGDDEKPRPIGPVRTRC